MPPRWRCWASLLRTCRCRCRDKPGLGLLRSANIRERHHEKRLGWCRPTLIASRPMIRPDRKLNSIQSVNPSL
jgi:hypothetical protein